MIGPDHLTQFILYVFYGFMTVDEAGQGKRLTLFLVWDSVVIYVLYEALYCHAQKMLENARSVILHEMTYYLLCMNPVKRSNNCCRLKRLCG